jgi:uncharacterized Zn finger protein
VSYYFEWRPYVSVAQRRRQAEKEVARLKKKGQSIDPVKIEGRTIAHSFWGKSWCANLERYSDFETRLPRGRTYVRNGSVVDLQVTKGKVTAMVAGSELYEIEIAIAPVKPAHWKSVCRDCAGSIDSLVELLQGRMAKGVMDRVCREGDGLFPAPREIKLSCSCPDWADMCKHVAAALYGIGARLDAKPELLFVLRGVEAQDLLAGAGGDLMIAKPKPGAAKVLAEDDVAALFGLEMAGSTDTAANAPAGSTAATPTRSAKKSKSRKTSAGTKARAANKAKKTSSRAITRIAPSR